MLDFPDFSGLVVEPAVLVVGLGAAIVRPVVNV
jgi:hypothetical protein